MEISNIKEIYDNDEFVTIETTSGSRVHLPSHAGHSITIDDNGFSVLIDFNQYETIEDQEHGGSKQD